MKASYDADSPHLVRSSPTLARGKRARMGPEVCFWLVVDSQHELDISRPQQGTADLTEVRVLYAGVGLVERMPVEGIEHLAAEVRRQALADRNVLVDAEVLIVEAESPNLARVTR